MKNPKNTAFRKNEEGMLPPAFLAYILRAEGGYANHPKDPGGATRYGITQKTLEKARKLLQDLPESVRHLSVEGASRMFYTFYYVPAGCALLPQPLDLVHFDGAVHCGVCREGKLLQQTLNRLDSSGRPLETDGLVGPRTLERVRSFAESGENRNSRILQVTQGLLLERMEFYGTLARKNPEIYGVFLVGWLKRLERLHHAALFTEAPRN